MKKNKYEEEIDRLPEKDKKSITSQIDSLDDDASKEEKFKRWEASEERAAMFDREERRPWLSMVGLLLGVLSWIALFALPKPGFANLDKQLYAMFGITLVAFLLSFFGRRRAFGMSVIGMLVSGGLMLFLIIALIVILLTK